MKTEAYTGATTSEEECAKCLAAVSGALYAIGGKWKLPVIIALRNGNKRFNELTAYSNTMSEMLHAFRNGV